MAVGILGSHRRKNLKSYLHNTQFCFKGVFEFQIQATRALQQISTHGLYTLDIVKRLSEIYMGSRTLDFDIHSDR
jgi:hypothetical protein